MATTPELISWDDGAADAALVNFNQAAYALEALIAQRDTDVCQAMAEYQADGVSAEYQAKEAQWRAAAEATREVITTLRHSLEQAAEIAAAGGQQAAASAARV